MTAPAYADDLMRKYLLCAQREVFLALLVAKYAHHPMTQQLRDLAAATDELLEMLK